MPRDPLMTGTRVIPPAETTRVFENRSDYRQRPDSPAITDPRLAYTEESARLDANLLKIIGRGIAYPFEFSDEERGVYGLEESWGKNRISQAIFLILSTRIGKRFFNPLFGSRLPLLVHEPYDEVLMDELIEATEGAVRRWEPRIIVTNVEILDDENWQENSQIGVKVEYVLANTNRKGNYVFPFTTTGEPSY